MRQFDSSLRRGLMDANLAQYAEVLQGADSAEMDFSPAYLRERMRLLADPWGWMRRRKRIVRRRGRLNWRLIALIAALLLLSACAVAMVTGQFSQWFPSRGVNYQAPEESEEVLGRTGTIIGQSRTEGEAEITLNAASWDGETLLLSLVMTSPDIPSISEEFTPGPSGPYGKGLHTAECYLSLREDQWFEYEKGRLGRNYSEKEARAGLDMGKNRAFFLDFQLLSREGDTLTFEVHTNLSGYVERPELTLHMEDISFFQNNQFHIYGPFDFTFTLEKTIPAIRYKCGGVEVTMGKPPLREVPLRFTGFEFSSTGVVMSFQVLAPVDMTMRQVGRYEPGLTEDEESSPLRFDDINFALWDGPLGIWTEDGSYVDLTNSGGGSSGGESWGRLHVDSSWTYPYPIDPAQVAALNIGGVRVELSELERLDG